jgi:hypothetical protein
MERVSPFAESDELEPGFVKVKLKVSGYRGYPKGAEFAVYETEAETMVRRGYADVVNPPAPVAPPEEEKKEVDGPPADKSVKRHNVKTK